MSGTHENGVSQHGPGASTEEWILPSRQAVLTRLRHALEAGPAAVLLTGEPGSGKTWLLRRLFQSLHWLNLIGIDLRPGIDARGLYRAMAQVLGLSDPVHGATALRISIEAALEEDRVDGLRHCLVIEESQLASGELLEEVRVLSNRLGQPNGLDAIILVGQTSLLRRLSTRPLRSIESRLDACLHLLPIDADEAAQLLTAIGWSRAGDMAEVEILHRDSQGNPARLLRLAHRIEREPYLGSGSAASRSARLLADHLGGADSMRTSPPESDEPLIPTRPPLLSEEGLIEVGWDAPSEEESLPDPRRESSEASPEGQTGPISDSFAALHAWFESAAPSLKSSDEDVARRRWNESGDELHTASEKPTASEGASVWTDEAHEIEPYGDLFAPKIAAPRNES